MSEVYDPFAEVGEGVPGLSWRDENEENLPPGVHYLLRITEPLAAPSQSRNIDGDLETWPDGNPKKEIIVKGEAVEVPAGAERLDGKVIGLHVRIPSASLRAIKAETTDKGTPITPGGMLKVTLDKRAKAKETDKYRTNFLSFQYTPADPIAQASAESGKKDDPWAKSDENSSDDPPF